MLDLTLEDRNIMEAHALRGAQDSLGRRAIILLRYADGAETREIAYEMGLTDRSVRRWRQAFEAEGINIFPVLEAQTLRGAKVGKTLTEQPSEREHRAVEQLVESGRFQRAHAEHVRRLAGDLFRLLQDVHILDKEHCRILEMAAYLHELVPAEVAKVSPKKTVQYLRQYELEGFTSSQQSLLQNLIRRQRCKVQFDASPVEGTHQTEALSAGLIAILCVALALDQADTQLTQVKEVIQRVDGILILVSGPKASEDAAAARRHSELLKRALGIPVRILTEERSQVEDFISADFPLPEPMGSPGIVCEDSLAEAGRKTLRFHFAEMLKNEEGTRVGEDIEALHDMRVAVRRMRVAFEIFEDVFTSKVRKQHLKGLRDIGRALGDVRDMDVFILKAGKYIQTAPPDRKEGLIPLTEAWVRQREYARQAMIKVLDSEGYRDFLRSFNVFLNSPGSGVSRRVIGRFGPHKVRHLAPRMIYDRLGRVRMYEPILAGASIEEIHALRIEFKKFRYTLEYLREVLGPETEQVIRKVKRVQDHLGDLNDADVACRILNQFIKEWESREGRLPLIERKNPEPVVAYLATKHDERHELMVSFGNIWEAFDSEDVRKKIAMAVSVI